MISLCPRCHRPFTKQIVRSETVSDSVDRAAPLMGTRSRPCYVDVTAGVVRFRYHYRCGHCGHVWAEDKILETNA